MPSVGASTGGDSSRRGARFARHQVQRCFQSIWPRQDRDVTVDITVAPRHFPEQRPIVALQPRLMRTLGVCILMS